MHVRLAKEEDIPAMIKLLKISLGESLMEKSEAFWRWKHEANPFGISPVLIALDGAQVVGVRAFMRWSWQFGNATIKAVRAVDTATHPQFQGKGIFTKLTLQLVDQCKAEGVDFIFNTPNKSSMPGYLKMGWKKFGRLKLCVAPVLWGNAKRASIQNRFVGDTPVYSIYNASNTDAIETPKTPEFVKWRYGLNPNIAYYHFKSESGHGVYRIKSGRPFTEMRFVEFQWDGKNRTELMNSIFNIAKSHRAHFISWTGFEMPLFGVKLPVGPMVTIHILNSEIAGVLEKWNPTLGDLEVF